VIRIELNNSQSSLTIDAERLREAVRRVLIGEGVAEGCVSLAVIDAATMHALNRKHLEHDYPTDVLSFLLDREGDTLDGEVIVSADEAILNAPRFGWPAEMELTLYAIHGTLHLCGYDDLEEAAAATMRNREDHWLAALGLGPARRGTPAVVAEAQP
jgi:probable rRNA maturation factor